MRRGDIHWGEVRGWGRRPLLVVSRTAALDVRSSITVAPVTTRRRELDSELPLGRREGVPRPCVASCDNLMTVLKDDLDPDRAGRLGPARLSELDRALAYALDIRTSSL